MTGRGHEGIASDIGQGPIFGVERLPSGCYRAAVREMGERRRLLASRVYVCRGEARIALRDLRRRLAEEPGMVAAVLAGWGDA